MTAITFESSPTSGPSLASLFQLIPAEVCPIAGQGSSPSLDELLVRVKETPVADPWLDATLALISDWARHTERDPAVRQSAENLTALLAGWSAVRRPSLAFDIDARPSFASKSPGYYLHLTLEEPNKLSWYAEVGDKEFFEDGVPFDGTSLPANLASLAT
jgi:hypothetical protein